MIRHLVLGAAGAALVVALAVSSESGASPKEETKPTVTFAKSWAAAVEEGKTLNLPIVVHSHGFYCGPCWGMHSSVLQNDKYIEYASENSVEVICLSRLDEGIQKGDPRAAEYEARDGKKYLVEFPGMTREEMLALASSKGASFNDTGRVPFTCIVDPHTEQELQRFSGGQSAKGLIEAIDAQKKALQGKHGPSTSRTLLRKFDDESKRILGDLPKAGVQKSLADVKKLEKAVEKGGEPLRRKLGELRDALLKAAAEQLDEVESLIASGDVEGAKKILSKIGRSLEGTDLAARAAELAAKTKA